MVYLYTIIWHFWTFFQFIISWGCGWRGYRGINGIGWGPGFVKWRHYKDVTHGMRQWGTITAINWSYRQNENAQSAQNHHFIYCFKSNINANYKSVKKIKHFEAHLCKVNRFKIPNVYCNSDFIKYLPTSKVNYPYQFYWLIHHFYKVSPMGNKLK